MMKIGKLTGSRKKAKGLVCLRLGGRNFHTGKGDTGSAGIKTKRESVDKIPNRSALVIKRWV